MITMKFLSIFLVILKQAECANILYIIPFSSNSHYIMLKPIGIELAKRGHNVTVITAFLEQNPLPNYHQVKGETRKIWELLGGEPINVFSTVDLSLQDYRHKVLWPSMLTFTEAWLSSEGVQHLLASNQSFDLVISEYFLQEASYMLAYKYKAPLALVTTFGNSMKHNILSRNPIQLSTVVFDDLKLNNIKGFLSRLMNTYTTFYEYYWWKYWYLEKQEELVGKYIPNLLEPIPSLFDLEKNSALLLVNSHFSFDGPVAYHPAIVEIGGLHVNDNNDTLPQNLQTLLDNSKNGVIYVCFGSNIRASDLPPAKRDAFLKVFARLSRYTVLWKWEEDDIANKSDNVILKKWLPQNLILAHPNIKVFLSHGGLLGTQEAIYHAVPIIGVPIYADQYNNLLQVQELGFGKMLEYNSINEDTLYSNLHEVLNNDSFKKKAFEISSRFRDRPMSPMETAMYWIEFIIRNKGAQYTKSPALEISWTAYLMLDVYAAIFIIFCLFITLSLVIVMFCRRYLRNAINFYRRNFLLYGKFSKNVKKD